MKTTLLATGKCKDKPIVGLVAEYVKRSKLFLPFSVVEVVGKDATAEAAAQLAKISANTILIGLDERGKTLSTQELARKIEGYQQQAAGEVIFLIGGADGLSPEVRARCNLLLSFGRMTLPHMLMRAVLAEQIYRVGTLIKGHPYHREG